MSDQPSWPTDDEGSQPPPPQGGNAPPPPPPPSSGSGAPPSYQQQDWGQPGYGAAPANQPTAATYGVRFGARIIDGLILLIPGFIISLSIGGGVSGLAAANSVSTWVAGLLTTLLGFAYYVWFESNQGATPGKKVLNLQVYGASGGNPTVEEAAKRNAFNLISLIPTGLGSLASLGAMIAIPITGSSDPYKRGWHDKFAGGTTVVKTG